MQTPAAQLPLPTLPIALSALPPSAPLPSAPLPAAPPIPCRTLYLCNLPENVKLPKLRSLLHALCSTHGKVVRLLVSSSLKLRGQAFVTYFHQSHATNALNTLHASTLLSRRLSVTYARTLTDLAASPKLGGTSTLSRNQRKDARRAEKARKLAQSEEERARLASIPVPVTAILTADEPLPPAVMSVVQPNRILFVENLPKLIDGKEDEKGSDVKAVLTDLFAKFAGFVEVRTVPGKDGIAFVEFGVESEAALAMHSLQGRVLGEPPMPMKVSFAKK